MTFAAAGPSALWYLTRGAGTVSMLLLTLSVALGIAVTRRVHTPMLPRFVIEAIHRNASLLAVAVLLVHVITSVLDAFAPIRLIDAILQVTIRRFDGAILVRYTAIIARWRASVVGTQRTESLC